MVIVALLTLWLMPAIHLQRESLLVQEESTVLLQTITPERFHAIQGGRVIFYVEKVSDKEHHLQGIFIAEKPEHPKGEGEPFQWSILTAHKGQILKEKGLPYFLLRNGVRYEGKPGHKDYTKVSFSRYERIIDEKPKKVPDFHRVTSTLALLEHTEPGYHAEFQWRLSLPLSVLIFGLLALPLAKTSPRSGRYEKLLPSILIYIFYYNLLAISKRWLENGSLTPLLGLWWVHVLMLCLALYLWFKQSIPIAIRFSGRR
jgi:lipopolysaccharide export system permease protein